MGYKQQEAYSEVFYNLNVKPYTSLSQIINTNQIMPEGQESDSHCLSTAGKELQHSMPVQRTVK